MSTDQPPGHPGSTPHWTSSAKSGVGTAPTGESRVWFTLSHGIVNEIYYPSIDQANTRDLGFLVADGQEFFSEEKRQTRHEILPLAQGVPGFRLTNTCTQNRYRLSKTVIADPHRSALLQQVHFEALQGQLDDYGLYALLGSHIGNQGYGNDGWVGDYKGMPMLFGKRAGTALALACSVPWKAGSVGYVGTSDGWQDISAHKRMTWFYPAAAGGNLALTGEVDLAASNGRFVVALGFGSNEAEAGQRARAALLDDFDTLVAAYCAGWQAFQDGCRDLTHPDESGFDLYRVSTAVLKTHEAKTFPGAIIASLSVPWGEIKGDDDLGGYHLVWPRDLVESAGALLAAGDVESCYHTMFYLLCTQDADGHWAQNMWVDGTPYWTGIQMDETALFVLVADTLRRMNRLHEAEAWDAVRRAAAFLARHGPVTQEGRWEENDGYSPFTLASEIAALLAAADFADAAGQEAIGTYLRDTADTWNANIEHWTYVVGTDLARQAGVEGYYVRIAPPAPPNHPTRGQIQIKNQPPGEGRLPAAYVVSLDALALVRFGLRAADDPRIVNTVKVIDAVLKMDTATGPVWHRYNDDGYGEHADGRPFDGTGIGRGWPLLAGERAHYELAAGHSKEARQLLQVMAAQTSEGGLLPEQVWDAADIPDQQLFNGHPSGSARPLVWAHAEHIKLLRSLHDGQIFDMPPQPVQRYIREKTGSRFTPWRFNTRTKHILAGKTLRIELLAPARVRWSTDGWQTTQDTQTTDSGVGIYYVDLPTEKLPPGAAVVFTFCWQPENRWEGADFTVAVHESAHQAWDSRNQ